MPFNFREFFGVGDDYYKDEVVDQPNEEVGPESGRAENMHEQATRPTQRAKVLSMDGSNRTSASKIALYEPRTYADAQTIATQILQGEAVIVNFGSIDEKNQLRVLDYIAGATFAVDGMVERVGEQIFLATPHNFEITGSLSQNIGAQFNN
ncbi:cell division protein SepF [Weissella halotolerans]|uniref:Cell division protein SepF n=1 Tax=Weissella halotolerans DSM 20190 TaxID=1123500 RepID=A0A0R2FWG1_9LACO|nr:cell division protein SepF [Weissella halotolerans]KRN31750.1 cell division protein [Weissella halotolerans DSM 20190]